MSDEKNDIDLDFEEKLAEIVSKKSRYPNNNNIYERFINRVENGDSDNGDSQNLENVQSQPSAPTPLIEEEHKLSGSQADNRAEALEFTAGPFDFMDQEIAKHSETAKTTQYVPRSFTDIQLDDDTFSLSSGFDEVTDETSAHVPNNDSLVAQDVSTQPTVNDTAKDSVKEIATSQAKPASDKKLLVIGMILGSLLIGIIVAILILTGVLSPSTQSNAPNVAETGTSSEVEGQALTTVENPLSADTNPDNIPTPASQQQASPASERQVVTADNTAEVPETAATLEAVSNTEPAITYEDFREESQNTVYRETED